MSKPFSVQRDRDTADAVDRHESHKASILGDTFRMNDALNDYLSDVRRLAPLDLARICITAQTDEAEAGRLLKEFAQAAAHECARYWLGDDAEVIEPAKPSTILADLVSGKALGIKS